ncbi:chondroitin sulfate N-acetylgalactosaminyltransferase 2-like [Scylla paramamosain]|uniref:chondroitin sulfate N-acetylgalactosaminyltransferase 2-like n=1 Tax=Scylla paramamosain TaxID=85552 RepID=UPI003082E1DA
MKDYIKVIRTPDPSLFHLYHKKECVETGDAAYVSCLKSFANTEGSKTQLGLAVLKMQHGTDIEGVLSKRFYYFWLVPYLSGLLVVSLLTNAILALLLVIFVRRMYGFKIL